jgi:hypothetical protein
LAYSAGQLANHPGKVLTEQLLCSSLKNPFAQPDVMFEMPPNIPS